MKQTKEQRDAVLAEVVATAKAHTAELNAGPMKHTLQRRAALEKKQSKRRQLKFFRKVKALGRVFIEEAMKRTGIDRTNLIGVIAYLIRTKQASGQGDALKRLESGQFDGVDFDEILISSYQVEETVVAVLDKDTED